MSFLDITPHENRDHHTFCSSFCFTAVPNVYSGNKKFISGFTVKDQSVELVFSKIWWSAWSLKLMTSEWFSGSWLRHNMCEGVDIEGRLLVNSPPKEVVIWGWGSSFLSSFIRGGSTYVIPSASFVLFVVGRAQRFWLTVEKSSAQWREEGGLKFGSYYPVTVWRCVIPGAPCETDRQGTRTPTMGGCHLLHREEVLQSVNLQWPAKRQAGSLPPPLGTQASVTEQASNIYYSRGCKVVLHGNQGVSTVWFPPLVSPSLRFWWS